MGKQESKGLGPNAHYKVRAGGVQIIYLQKKKQLKKGEGGRVSQAKVKAKEISQKRQTSPKREQSPKVQKQARSREKQSSGAKNTGEQQETLQRAGVLGVQCTRMTWHRLRESTGLNMPGRED